MSTLGLGPTEPSTPLAMVILTPECEFDNHLRLVPRLRINGAKPLVPLPLYACILCPGTISTFTGCLY
jgi:hypothetical protein